MLLSIADETSGKSKSRTSVFIFPLLMRRHKREWKAERVAKATAPGYKLTEQTPLKVVALVIYESFTGVKTKKGKC